MPLLQEGFRTDPTSLFTNHYFTVFTRIFSLNAALVGKRERGSGRYLNEPLFPNVSLTSDRDRGVILGGVKY